jgi:hypothetical protein
MVDRNTKLQKEKDYKIAVIKEHMQLSHRKDPTPGYGRRTRKRIVSPKEYQRIDVELASLPDNNATVKTRFEGAVAIGNDNGLGSDEDSGEKGHSFSSNIYCTLDGIDEIDHWSSLYDRAVPDNDHEEYCGEKVSHDDNIKNDSEGEDFEDKKDDTYEVQPDPMSPLPKVDDDSYPYEDIQYFATKKYVRNDKYSLQKMIFKDVELPSLESVL